MMSFKARSASLVALAVAMASPAQERPSPPRSATTFVTLGTQGGPVPDPRRSQPANLLLVGGQAVMIDAGDGAAERLAGAGVPLAAIHTLFLSHLHLDHTAGLQAIIGLRWMTNAPGVLTIYGPVGTRRLVDGLLASMEPAEAAGFGFPGPGMRPADGGVRVIELHDGSTLALDWGVVRVVRNSHYSFIPGSAEDARSASFSYRFETPGRTIVYTGDTGVSPAVTALAHGADLLVSEVIDLDLFHAHPPIPPGTPDAIRIGVMRHLEEHHLTPRQVGELARDAGVKSVVLTHLSGCDAPGSSGCVAGVRAVYPGPVVQARDLQRF